MLIIFVRLTGEEEWRDYVLIMTGHSSAQNVGQRTVKKNSVYVLHCVCVTVYVKLR